MNLWLDEVDKRRRFFVAADLNALRIKDEYLRRVLEGEAFLLFDGAFGTMMQRAQLTLNGENPDLLNLAQPEAITAIHRAYVEAGAQVATSNTFGANVRKLEGAATVAEVYEAAVRNARAAGARYVAGDIGPTGALLKPMGSLGFEEAYEIFAEQVQAVDAAGCDLIVIETMSDLLEMKAAVLAACDNCDLPVFATMTFGEDGRTFLGTTPAVAAATLSSLGVAAVGVNCSLGPDELGPIVEEISRFARCPVMVQPNAGLPRVEGGKTVYDVSPEGFVASMQRILDAGATIVGGCCGTDPSFIAALSEMLAQRKPKPRLYEPAFCVTSAQEAVVLPQGEHRVAVIGERINPTGKKRLKEALRAADYDYVIGEAVAQQKAGADLLDVNAGLPEIDEPVVLRELVETLQATMTLPLQIDSSDPEAIETAARAYAGKPLVNSVNGKQSNLDAVLPIVKKYGCSVVGLTLDEDGIPPTAEGRFAIAERIVGAAEAAGIPRCDIAIDCLVMAAATNQSEVMEILRALTMCKERLGVRTVLGVSNVSFGMPQRNMMNATFLAAAFGAGLDMPILNPLSARYRDTVNTFRVLNGQDAGAVGYIGEYAGSVDPYEAAAGVGAAAGSAVAGSGAAAGKGAGVNLAGGVASGMLGVAGGTAGAVAGAADGCAPGVDGALAVADCPIAIAEAFAGDAAAVAEAASLALAGRGAPLAQLTKQMLERHEALAVINDVFVPILDVVGQKYERGEFFLPQLMASAEAVKAGFEVVRAVQSDEAGSVGEGEISSVGEGASCADDRSIRAGENLIVVATVEGDIHDIGKNIVKMLLENYGFGIIDAGRDVAPQRVVDVAREQGARFVVLSALMTTTVKAMEQTVKLIHDQLPDCAVMVGGAVLTSDYAAEIGADFYAKDAAEAARIASMHFANTTHPGVS